MKDSLMSNFSSYHEGWLLALDLWQYLGLVLILALFLVSWRLIRPSDIKVSSDVKGSVLKGGMWIARLLISVLLLVGMLEVLGLGWREFLSAPVFSAGETVPISPFFVLSLVFCIFLLWFLNKIIKSMVAKATDKWRFDYKVGRQLRRFFMLFMFAAIGSLWLKQAGHFLLGVFNEGMFTVNNVEITLGALIYTFIILYGVSLGVKLLELLYTRYAVSRRLNVGQSRTVFSLFKYAFWLLIILLLLDSYGLNLTVLVASSAALMVGLGFGVQGLFNDYISGMVLLFEGSIKVGHVVEIGKEFVGRVMDVGLRTSKILTRDNIIMIVPNHKFVQDNVINWSYNESKTRFFVDVGVAYGSDVRLVEKLLIDSAQEQDEVIAEPKAFVLFRDFGDSALGFRLYFWVEEVFFVERLKSKVRFAIDQKFRDNGIQIPFPQTDLHLKSGWEKLK